MSQPQRFVQVCQNRTCLRSHSDRVLACFRAEAADGVLVAGSGCLGQCGSGPMVRITPDNIWYCRVHTRQDVIEIVAQHLKGERPVRRLMHPRIHAYYDFSGDSGDFLGTVQQQVDDGASIDSNLS